MLGHIKWNGVSKGVIISMLLLVTIGCSRNIKIEDVVDQNTVEIQKVADKALRRMDATQDENEKTEDKMIVLPEGQFYEIIKNNPIDQDYKWEDIGVEDRIVKAGKYYQAWCEEIENSLNHLQVYLDSEDYEQLYSSYVGWQQYMNGMFSVEQSIYYVGSKYMASSDLAGGSSTYPVVMEVKARRAREYAIQLMALEYTFSQDIQFVYK